MSSEAIEGPGAALRAARESLGITCREVAEALNLSLRVVEAIEVNDYERLPATVFARGYVRAYAKLLELDPDPIVARFSVDEADDAGRDETSFNSIQDLVRRHPEWILGGGAVIAIALLGLVLYALWPLSALFETGDDVNKASQSIETEAGVSTESVASNIPPDALNSQHQETREREVREGAQPDFATLQPQRQAATSGDALAVRNPEALSDLSSFQTPRTSVRRISAMGNDLLWFSFTDECWVEVLSTTGENLYSDLSRSGQTLELVGSGPFRILLGYAPGVRMAYNGEPVVLGPHTRNNVANLVLGQ